MKEKIEIIRELLGELNENIEFEQNDDHCRHLMNIMLDAAEELEFILEDKL